MDRRQFINLTGLAGMSLLVSFDLSGRIIARIKVPVKGVQGFALEKMLSDNSISWSQPEKHNSPIKNKPTQSKYALAQLFNTASGEEVTFTPPIGTEYTVRTNMNGLNNQTDTGLYHEYTVQCDSGMLPELTFEFSGANPLPAWSFLQTEQADEYLVRIIVPTDDNAVSETLRIYFSQIVDGIDQRRTPERLPQTIKLLANYPNPFNSTTTIRFQLLRKQHIRVEVLDLLGRKMKTLYEGIKNSGMHSLRWNGRDGQNKPAASGTYVLRISGDGKTLNQIVKTGRMVMVK